MLNEDQQPRGKGMYGMVDKEYVRKRHIVDGWSIRKLSSQLNIARQTVRKLLEDSEIPKYNRQQDRACPVMDPYRAFIENILLEDKNAPVKQRHTSARIFGRLPTSMASLAESQRSVIT
jgi:hypothetical protein